MDPISVIVGALTAGAMAAVREVAGQAVFDGYKALKALIARKFGEKARVEAAMEAVEQRPGSEGRQEILKEQLEASGVDQDEQVLQQARDFLDLLNAHGLLSGAFYQAIVSGSGAVAQAGSVAAGEGGVPVGGDVEGGVHVSLPWDEPDEYG